MRNRMGTNMLAFRRTSGWAVALGALMMIMVAAVSRPAAANPETFTQGLIDQGVSILGDKSGGVQARNARFRSFLEQYADIRAAAMFTLGNYRRSATEAELSEFSDAFKEFAIAIYEKRLEQYAGQTLKVTKSVQNKPGDFTVYAEEAGRGPDALKVAFRLLGSEGSYRFVDVNVAGVWLSVEQRDQFSSFLSSNGGKIPLLTADLRRQAASIRSGR
jgi:phospholipid transport system substrate-binding protein